MKQAKQDYARAYSVVRDALRAVVGGDDQADDLCFFLDRPLLRVRVKRCYLGLPTQSGLPVVFMYGGLAQEMAQTLEGRGVLAMVV